MAPTLEDFANEVKKKEMPLLVGRINCIKSRKLCESEKFNVFATL
jgi:hypothetical protein